MPPVALESLAVEPTFTHTWGAGPKGSALFVWSGVDKPSATNNNMANDIALLKRAEPPECGSAACVFAAGATTAPLPGTGAQRACGSLPGPRGAAAGRAVDTRPACFVRCAPCASLAPASPLITHHLLHPARSTALNYSGFTTSFVCPAHLPPVSIPSTPASASPQQRL